MKNPTHDHPNRPTLTGTLKALRNGVRNVPALYWLTMALPFLAIGFWPHDGYLYPMLKAWVTTHNEATSLQAEVLSLGLMGGLTLASGVCLLVAMMTDARNLIHHARARHVSLG